MTPPTAQVKEKQTVVCYNAMLTHVTFSKYRATKLDKDAGEE